MNYLFFDNVAGWAEKEILVNVSCWCSVDGIQNPAFLGHFKINIKKIFSDTLHKGIKGIETTYKLQKNSEQSNSRSTSGEIVFKYMVA